jgi:hypothetical protein
VGFPWFSTQRKVVGQQWWCNSDGAAVVGSSGGAAASHGRPPAVSAAHLYALHQQVAPRVVDHHCVGRSVDLCGHSQAGTQHLARASLASRRRRLCRGTRAEPAAVNGLCRRLRRGPEACGQLLHGLALACKHVHHGTEDHKGAHRYRYRNRNHLLAAGWLLLLLRRRRPDWWWSTCRWHWRPYWRVGISFRQHDRPIAWARCAIWTWCDELEGGHIASGSDEC